MNAYVTQIGPDGSGHERCGAAVVASILLSAGWHSDPWGLLLEVAGKLWGGAEPSGSSPDQLQAVLRAYGFSSGLWLGWSEAVDALRQDHYVACLLDNWYLVPRPYPPGPSWNAEHWLRLVALVDGDEYAYLYDPLAYLATGTAAPYQGPTIATVASLRAAIAATPDAWSGIIAWRD